MYHVSAQGVDEHMINVHYYYYHSVARLLPPFVNTEFVCDMPFVNTEFVGDVPFVRVEFVCDMPFVRVEFVCLSWPVFSVWG